MIGIDAFHLPHHAVGGHRAQAFGGIVLRHPVLTPDDVAAIAGRLRGAADALRACPLDRVVAVIDAAAARFDDRSHPLGRSLAEAALPAITGASAPMIALVLDRLTADLQAASLRSLLEAELRDPAVLDAFVRDGPRRTRAVGGAAAFHVFAGNVPGVAVTSLVRSLLTKTPTLGKSASGEPLLPAIFARLIAEVDPAIGGALAVAHWPGGEETLLRAAADAADVVVVYGGTGAVQAVRAHVRPEARLIVHGPHLSIGVVAREALSDVDRTAGQAARAVATFDQQGCVSPHAIFVETGGAATPLEFARALDVALSRLAVELPRGSLQPAEAAALLEERASAEFREIGGEAVRVVSAPDAPHVVVYEEGGAFLPSCLNRFVRVRPVAGVDDVADLMRPAGALLQTVGVAGPPQRMVAIAERFATLHATRITPLEHMPWPPSWWHHDGSGPLRELLRFVDLED